MAKTFRPYEPDRLLLLPPSLADWVPEDHLARFVSDVAAYIATTRQPHGERLAPAPRGRPPKALSVRGRMARKLRTVAVRAVYACRKKIVEPMFGQIKHARRFRQFLRRGLHNVGEEWALMCTVHNLLKLFAARALT